VIDVAPETYSRWENGRQRSSLTVDRLVRLYYALNCDDPQLAEAARRAVDQVPVARRKGEPATIAASRAGNRWRAPRAA
jgi:transcriptional regulator with XRE-family HTH domain